jgi:DNA polymerase III sliding clamp (beta) subunit (PCNA family)
MIFLESQKGVRMIVNRKSLAAVVAVINKAVCHRSTDERWHYIRLSLVPWVSGNEDAGLYRQLRIEAHGEASISMEVPVECEEQPPMLLHAKELQAALTALPGDLVTFEPRLNAATGVLLKSAGATKYVNTLREWMGNAAPIERGTPILGLEVSKLEEAIELVESARMSTQLLHSVLHCLRLEVAPNSSPGSWRLIASNRYILACHHHKAPLEDRCEPKHAILIHPDVLPALKAFLKYKGHKKEPVVVRKDNQFVRLSVGTSVFQFADASYKSDIEYPNYYRIIRTPSLKQASVEAKAAFDAIKSLRDPKDKLAFVTIAFNQHTMVITGDNGEVELPCAHRVVFDPTLHVRRYRINQLLLLLEGHRGDMIWDYGSSNGETGPRTTHFTFADTPVFKVVAPLWRK